MISLTGFLGRAKEDVCRKVPIMLTFSRQFFHSLFLVITPSNIDRSAPRRAELHRCKFLFEAAGRPPTR